jgi:hypothetical protein
LFHHRVRFDAKPCARWSRSRAATGALSSLNRWKGGRRAAFWHALGFPNLVRARAALANKVRLRRLEEWKREELKRTPFAILDEPPPELSPVKRARGSFATKPQAFVSDEGPRTKRSHK